MRILHIAPEPSVRRLLPRSYYTAGDLNPSGDAIPVDLTHMRFADSSFDAVLCNHVLEHIPDDRAAISEIHRVLRRGGWAIVMTPILVERTYEDLTITDPAERRRRFGQEDHVRRYGWDYIGRLEDSGFAVEVIRGYSRDEIRWYGLNNREGFVEPLFLATAS